MKTEDIPEFLRHLRRDRRGLPVPYVNLWGDEDNVDIMTLETDRNVENRLAVFMHDQDETEPNFLHQSHQRQRECMTEGLCQVCGRFVPWSRRWLVVSNVSVETILLNRKPVPAVTEPWLDQRCAEFAVKYCPALIRRRRDEELTMVEVTSKRQVNFAMSWGSVEGPFKELSEKYMPVMWVKLMLPGVQIQVVNSDAAATV